MEKPARTNVEIHELLTKRYSPRAFSSKQVEREKLEKMLEAARWAPSASNDQPWCFIIGIKEHDEIYDKIYDSLLEFNKEWNINVQVLILICAHRISVKTGKENPYRLYDTGQAAAHMTFQATAEGLYVHQMGGFDKEKVIKLLKIPEEIDPVTVMSVGYLGELKDLPERFHKQELAERTRKTITEIVF